MRCMAGDKTRRADAALPVQVSWGNPTNCLNIADGDFVPAVKVGRQPPFAALAGATPAAPAVPPPPPPSRLFRLP